MATPPVKASTINVIEYNRKSEDIPGAPLPRDVNGNGIVDSGDTVVFPKQDESQYALGAEAQLLQKRYPNKPSYKFLPFCDIMAPGATKFELTPAAKQFLQKNVDKGYSNGPLGRIIQGRQSQLLVLDAKSRTEEIVIRSAGTFHPDDSQCHFNEPGQIKVDVSQKDSHFFLSIEGKGEKGPFKATFEYDEELNFISMK